MRTVIVAILAIAGMASMGSAAQQKQTRAEKELTDALKDRTAGTPTDCVSTMNLDGPQIIDSKTVLYRQGSTVWRADVLGDCPGMSPMDTIVIRLNGSQMCRLDRFNSVDPGMRIPGPSCTFDKFTPYKKAK